MNILYINVDLINDINTIVINIINNISIIIIIVNIIIFICKKNYVSNRSTFMLQFKPSLLINIYIIIIIIIIIIFIIIINIVNMNEYQQSINLYALVKPPLRIMNIVIIVIIFGMK